MEAKNDDYDDMVVGCVLILIVAALVAMMCAAVVTIHQWL